MAVFFMAAAFRVSASYFGVVVGVLASFSLLAYQFSFLSVQALFSFLQSNQFVFLQAFSSFRYHFTQFFRFPTPWEWIGW